VKRLSSRRGDDREKGAAVPGAPNDETLSILEALQGVLQEMSEPIAVLEAILRHAVRHSGAERAIVAEVPIGGGLEFSVLRGHQGPRFKGDADAFSRSVFDRVLRSGECLRIENTLDDPYFREIESVRALSAAALLCMPIREKGRVVALLHLEHRRKGHFKAAHEEMLRSLVAMAGPVLGALRAGRAALAERDRLRTAESELRREAEAERRWIASEWSFGRFIGHSPAIRGLEEAVRRAAATDYPVVLHGEPGTGKNLLARVMHYGGSRGTRPFVTVFCPSLERGRVESALFGHKRGAFTDAHADAQGHVQAADGGTLFLDEIGELPLEIQPKLLRFLQDGKFERLGDPAERTANVRIIAATNRDLAAEMREKKFRRDLYDRLNYLPIRVPPLRERVEDIPLLLRHCLDQTAAGRWIEVSDEALEYLVNLDFTWPGNVRHIEQLAARLTTDGLDGPVQVRDVARLLDTTSADAAGEVSEHGPWAGLRSVRESAERRSIEDALRRHPGLSRAELAAKLQISEAALYRKLRQYGLGE